jgi:hypothetical protein
MTNLTTIHQIGIHQIGIHQIGIHQTTESLGSHSVHSYLETLRLESQTYRMLQPIRSQDANRLREALIIISELIARWTIGQTPVLRQHNQLIQDT